MVKTTLTCAGASEAHSRGTSTAGLAPVAPSRAEPTAVGLPNLSLFPTAGLTVELAGPPRYRSGQPLLDVVVPIYNEGHVLAESIRYLRSYLDREFPFPAVVTIVDNGSTDESPVIATLLAAELHGVRFLHLKDKGRGGALRAAWSCSEARVLAYMDVDLSTELDALLPLVAPLLSEHSAVAIGSRLAPGARVVRSRKRELISRTYNMLLKALLRCHFSDAQCGFKALTADAAHLLLPEVQDNEWFFDTELLVRAQRRGLNIHEVAVEWVEDPDSRVDIVRTSMEDLKGILRLLRRRNLPHVSGVQPQRSRKTMPLLNSCLSHDPAG